jgi:hypothetical protein
MGGLSGNREDAHKPRHQRTRRTVVFNLPAFEVRSLLRVIDVNESGRTYFVASSFLQRSSTGSWWKASCPVQFRPKLPPYDIVVAK